MKGLNKSHPTNNNKLRNNTMQFIQIKKKNTLSTILSMNLLSSHCNIST